MKDKKNAPSDGSESSGANEIIQNKDMIIIDKIQTVIDSFQENLTEKNIEFNSYFTAEYLLNRKTEKIPFLLESILHRVGLAAIAGSSDTGKSSFLRQLCIEVCSGNTSYLGFGINAIHKSAIYVSTEDDDEAVSYLLNKQNNSLHIESDKLAGLRFIFDSENLIENLDKRLTEKPADLVVVDAFTDIYGKSMNESNQVRGFLNEYGQLAKKHKCLVIFLHHCGKRTESEPPSKNNLLGSQAFEAKMRLVMELRSDNHDPKIKHLCLVKGNYLPAEYKQESYQLIFTENMTFESTNIRIPFELLKKDQANGDKEKYERIKELQSQGLNYEQIAESIGYKSKGSITKIIAKFENNKDVS